MKFVGRGDRLINNTYVGNLVDALLLAVEKPVIGETFNIRDERLVTREEFVNTIADYLGKPHPRHVPEFIPGIELSRAFYDEVVSQVVGDIRHSAALVGTGSDVLGFDTRRSTDHGWGPRLHLFVAADDVEHVTRAIGEALPHEFRGWPTRYGWDDVPVAQHVVIVTLSDWLEATLGFDPRRGVSLWQWLGTPQQILLEVTGGAVHHDPDAELATVRDALGWYPDDVWLWLLACQWRRIDQEEPFVGRAAEVGDELGSRVLAARLVRDVMRLCFLLERRYAPYGKWLGTAFRGLQAHEALGSPLQAVLEAKTSSDREAALVATMQTAAGLHNALGVTCALDESVTLFHSRPYRVLGSARFVDACLERVQDERLRALPLVGAIDQFVDSTDVSSHPHAATPFERVFEAWLG
jgi:hypothetical protein